MEGPEQTKAGESQGKGRPILAHQPSRVNRENAAKKNPTQRKNGNQRLIRFSYKRKCPPSDERAGLFCQMLGAESFRALSAPPQRESLMRFVPAQTPEGYAELPSLSWVGGPNSVAPVPSSLSVAVVRYQFLLKSLYLTRTGIS